MSKSPKQKSSAGASLLANVRMTARDMPGADPVQGVNGSAGNTPRCNEEWVPTQDAVVLGPGGGFKYLLFSSLLGEMMQFD